jgi:hypothetical protein
MLLVLTHDVDWSRRGPSPEHVIARLERFDWEHRYRFFALRENIYNGVQDIVEAEQRQGVKSTFFFRPLYDDGTTAELYADVISELRRGGWEVGLHANNGTDINAIYNEKKVIEKLYTEPVRSVRVHYLRIDPKLIPQLSKIGIRIDSSVTFSKTGLSTDSADCVIYGDVIELPVTIMDAYMFTYWGVKPEEAYRKLIEALTKLRQLNVTIVTLLWHTNSVRMRGGKDYLKLIEDIWRFEWIEPVRAMDIIDVVKEGKALCRKAEHI